VIVLSVCVCVCACEIYVVVLIAGAYYDALHRVFGFDIFIVLCVFGGKRRRRRGGAKDGFCELR
jgi:hypothetical protein